LIIKRFLYRFLRNCALPGLLFLSIVIPAQVWAANILVLGDSISAAYGMSLEQGWVALLETRLAEQSEPRRVINASISGETTAGGLRRLPALLEQHQPQLVIIELGANDGLRGYPIGRFRTNLESLVVLSQQSGARVILLPMEIPPNYGARYTSDFRNTFVAVAGTTNSTLAPFILDGVATNPGLMQPDGLHPKAEAQPLILENVLPSVLETLEKS
jgi:acyl-CoA thioesterase-1